MCNNENSDFVIDDKSNQNKNSKNKLQKLLMSTLYI